MKENKRRQSRVVNERKVFVLNSAPYFKNLAEVARGLNISRVTLYDYMKGDDMFKDAFYTLLGTELDDDESKEKVLRGLGVSPYRTVTIKIKDKNSGKIRKKPIDLAAYLSGITKAKDLPQLYVSYEAIQRGEKLADSITGISCKNVRKMANKKSKTRKVIVEVPEEVVRITQIDAKKRIIDDLSDGSKIEKTQSICELYAAGIPISDACKSLSVDVLTFLNWTQEAHPAYVKGVKVLFDAAKFMYSERVREDLLVISRNAILKVIQPRKVVSITKTGRVTEDGKIIPVTVVQHEKELQPNVSILRDVMKLLREFKTGGAEGDEDQANRDLLNLYKGFTEEELDNIINKLSK